MSRKDAVLSAAFNGRHPLAIAGVALCVVATAGLLFALLVDLFGGIRSSYAGLLLYAALPGLLILGGVLVLFGNRLTRRARPNAPGLVIDCGRPAHRARLAIVLASFSLLGVALAGATHQSLEYMATTHFCAEVCHEVMEPQAVNHRLSAHAQVECVECHIGPGVSGFARAKLGGLRQTWGQFIGRYQRPVPAEDPDPVLGRVVCERCHDADRDYGMRARVLTTFGPADHTRTDTPVKLRVGSPREGIHAHIGMELYFLTPDHGRTVSRVRVRRADGSEDEYAAEDAPAEGRWLPLGCTGCHNRVGHELRPFEKRLDDALRAGDLPLQPAGLKQKALEAVGEPESPPDRTAYEEMRRALTRASGGDALVEQELHRLQAATFFPRMNAGPQSYPSWLGHVGCYRCHGALEPVGGGRSRLPGATQCTACHQMP